MSLGHQRSRTAGLLLALLLLVTSGGAPAAGQGGPAVMSLNVEDIFNLVGRQAGHPTVVIVYQTLCSRSAAMFPAFAEFARRVQPKGVEVLALSTNTRKDPVEPFLAQHQFPFTAYHLNPWPQGELSAAMRRIGAQVGPTFELPLVIVFDRNGQAIAMGEAVMRLEPVEQAVEAVLGRR